MPPGDREYGLRIEDMLCDCDILGAGRGLASSGWASSGLWSTPLRSETPANKVAASDGRNLRWAAVARSICSSCVCKALIDMEARRGLVSETFVHDARPLGGAVNEAGRMALLATLWACSAMTTPLGGRRFVLLRHGQTDWNAEGRMQGTSDLSRLTLLGFDQAVDAGVALSRLLGDTPVKAVYASPLSRAQRTLELVTAEWPAAAAAVGGQSLLDDLKEVELLEWSGRLSHDVKREEPGRYRCAAREGSAQELPGLSAFADVYNDLTVVEPPLLS
jgi:hypothetical protein